MLTTGQRCGRLAFLGLVALYGLHVTETESSLTYSYMIVRPKVLSSKSKPWSMVNISSDRSEVFMTASHASVTKFSPW
jgi:hypothetical protein